MEEELINDAATAWKNAAKVLWQSLVPTNPWNPTFGLEKAWMNNVQDWGYPLEAGEIVVNHNGTTYQGRHFSKVFLVIWDPAKGASVVGKPDIT